MKNPKTIQDYLLTIYDNEGKTLDQITILFNNTATDDIFGTRLHTYECIGASYNGVSFYQHTHCQKGKYLGKKILFGDLDEELREKVNDEIKETL